MELRNYCASALGLALLASDTSAIAKPFCATQLRVGMKKQDNAGQAVGTEVSYADYAQDEVNVFLREKGCLGDVSKVRELLTQYLSANEIKTSIVRDPSEDDGGTIEFLVRSPLERKQFNQSLRQFFARVEHLSIHKYMGISRDC